MYYAKDFGNLRYYVSQSPTRCNCIQFILSVNFSTCFGWFLHPSSGAQITVFTLSGTSQPLLLLTVGIVEELNLNSSTIPTGSSNGSLKPDAVDRVICAPDDGWKNHPKHVEQFTDKINCIQLHLF